VVSCRTGKIAAMRVEVLKRARVATYVAFLCAIGWLSSGYSQESHRDIPPNAHPAAGAQGWACNNGFRQVAGLCMEDKEDVPSWGAFEVFADGQWRCLPGYHRDGSYCVPATAPAHATYIGGGERWECDWGFQKSGASCEEIKPPAHAYIEGSGREWVCYPGFERKSDHCAAAPGAGPAGDKASTSSEESKPEAGTPRGKR
jgi:hypothetical protein